MIISICWLISCFWICTNSRFEGDTFFYDSSFTGDANFWNSSFSGDAIFMNSSFTGTADFRDSSFSGRAIFRYSSFKKTLSFQDSLFCKKLSLDRCIFQSIFSLQDVLISHTCVSWENWMCHTRATRRTHPCNAGNFLRHFLFDKFSFCWPFFEIPPGPGPGPRAEGRGPRARARAEPEPGPARVLACSSDATLFLWCYLVPLMLPCSSVLVSMPCACFNVLCLFHCSVLVSIRIDFCKNFLLVLIRVEDVLVQLLHLLPAPL